MVPEEVREFSIEPITITNLDCKFAGIRQLLQERNQPVCEFVPVLDLPFVKKWKLKHCRPELLAKNAHRIQELFKLDTTVHQNFVMRNGLRNFDREDEARGRSRSPVADR